MTELAQEQWEEQRQATANAVLLDVRTEEEFNAKHIPGASMIDIRQPQAFMEAAQALDKDKGIFHLLSFWSPQCTSLPSFRSIGCCCDL